MGDEETMTEEEVLSKGADAPLTENPRTKPGLTYAAGGGQSPTPPITLGIPTCGLKESIRNLKILYRSTNGEICPRCEGTEFNKLGTYTYKGKSYPKKLCRNCGYTFSIIDLQKDGSTRNRAARIFNLDNKKADDLINDALLIRSIGKIPGIESVEKNYPDPKKRLRPIQVYSPRPGKIEPSFEPNGGPFDNRRRWSG